MTTYTVAKIDAASITKAGLALFELMPLEIRDNKELSYEADREMRDRVKTILSLMARNGAKSWAAMENGSHAGPGADYYHREAWKHQGAQRAAMVELAQKASEQWVAHWEKAGEMATERLHALAAILSEVTGYTWTIDTGGNGMGEVLVIPEGVTGARGNSTSKEGHRPAIWLSHH
jgi:hypothetical protein